jgi:uncharacterized protein YbjT (DUF2867 family)
MGAMRYAMTGATGFVGGELSRQLRAAGHEVVALVRDPSRATDLGVPLVSGDLDGWSCRPLDDGLRWTISSLRP